METSNYEDFHFENLHLGKAQIMVDIQLSNNILNLVYITLNKKVK